MRFFSNLLCVAALATQFCFATRANATVLSAGDIVKLDRVGANGGASGGGEFSIYKYLGKDSTNHDMWDSLGLQTFCVEFNEHLAIGEKLLVGAVSDRAVKGGLSGQLTNSPDPFQNGADPLDPRTQFLYRSFATNSIPLSTGFVDGSDPSSNALQQAIWYLEGEVNALTSSVSTALYQYANTYTGPALSSVFVLNLFSLDAPLAGFNPLDNRTWPTDPRYLRQDQLFYVAPTTPPGSPPTPMAPEPGSATIWLAAMGLLGCSVRFRAGRAQLKN